MLKPLSSVLGQNDRSRDHRNRGIKYNIVFILPCRLISPGRKAVVVVVKLAAMKNRKSEEKIILGSVRRVGHEVLAFALALTMIRLRR